MKRLPFVFSMVSIFFAGCTILFFVIANYRAARKKKKHYQKSNLFIS